MNPSIDHAAVFLNAPVGICVSSRRTIKFCNLTAARMFGYPAEALAGRSFSVLYPSWQEAEHTSAQVAAAISSNGSYSGEQIMKRADGDLFWCRVSGNAHHGDGAQFDSILVFTEICAKNRISNRLTPRERQIAPLLLAGKTSKAIGQEIGLSQRTVEYYRHKMMRKLAVANYKELISNLFMDMTEQFG